MEKTIETVIQYLAGELVKEGLIECVEVNTAIEVLQAGLIDLEKLDNISLIIE